MMSDEFLDHIIAWHEGQIKVHTAFYERLTAIRDIKNTREQAEVKPVSQIKMTQNRRGKETCIVDHTHTDDTCEDFEKSRETKPVCNCKCSNCSDDPHYSSYHCHHANKESYGEFEGKGYCTLTGFMPEDSWLRRAILDEEPNPVAVRLYAESQRKVEEFSKSAVEEIVPENETCVWSIRCKEPKYLDGLCEGHHSAMHRWFVTHSRTDEFSKSAGGTMRLRTGRKVGRTIYMQHGEQPSNHDTLIGMVDTQRLADIIVEAVNIHWEEAMRVAFSKSAVDDESNSNALDRTLSGKETEETQQARTDEMSKEETVLKNTYREQTYREDRSSPQCHVLCDYEVTRRHSKKCVL